MALALDSSGSPASQTTSFSFTHTPVGTVRAVIIGVIQDVGATDEITSVTYGGVTVSRVAAAFKATGETGAAYVYHLGTGIPTGPQTVAVNVNGTASNKRVVVWALTAAKDTVVINSQTLSNDSLANPLATLLLNGQTSWGAILFFSGQDLVASLAPLANWTATLTQQWASNLRTGGGFRYNTIAAVDIAAGWTQTADDAIMVALAVTEQFYIGKVTRLSHASSIVDLH